MTCPSCAAQANGCDCFVSYASLVGARIKLATSAGGAPGPAARWEGPSSGQRTLCPPSPERWAIMEFLREFSSAVPATWQRVAAPRPVLTQPLWATRTLTTRSPGAYGQPWETPWTTPHVQVPHRHQPVDPDSPRRWSALSTVPSRPTNEIRPQRPTRRGFSLRSRLRFSMASPAGR
jgi:hypothetical protein